MSHRGISRGSTWRDANAKGPPRRMEVSIPQNNLRVFAAAVQCLMKVSIVTAIDCEGATLNYVVQMSPLQVLI